VPVEARRRFGAGGATGRRAGGPAPRPMGGAAPWVTPPLHRSEARAGEGPRDALLAPHLERCRVERDVDCASPLDDREETGEMDRLRGVLLVESEDSDPGAVRRAVVDVRTRIHR